MATSSADSARPIVYRMSRKRRQAVVAFAVVGWLLFVGSQAAVFLFLRPLRDLAFLESSKRFGWLVPFELLVCVALAMVLAYIAGYWVTYRIELDDEAISRKGLPHIFDRRLTIRYEEIDFVTHGTIAVLRVVPRQGRVLATNLNLLEGAKPALVQDLRARLGEARVPPGLETALLKKHAIDRASIAIAYAGIVWLLPLFSLIFFKDQMLKVFGWDDLAEDVEEVLAIDTAPDGSVAILAESEVTEQLLGVRVLLIGDTDVSSTELPRDVAALGSQVSETMRRHARDLVIDDQGRLWVRIVAEEELFVWDGERWRGVDPIAGSGGGAPGDIERVGGEIWVVAPELEGIVRIDPDALVVSGLAICGTSDELEGTARFSPRRLYPASDGGLVVAGQLTPGDEGIAHFDAGGTCDLVAAVDKSTLESGPMWSLAHVGIDAAGTIYAAFSAPDVCAYSDWMLPVWIREPGGEWYWSRIGDEIQCDDDPRAESFAVDPRGRVWVQGSFGEGEELRVYQGTPTSEGTGFALVHRYTRENSHYPGGELTPLRDGRIVAYSRYRAGLVYIDGSREELPREAPPWVESIINNPILIWIPYMIFAFVPIGLSLRHNLRRQPPPASAKNPTEDL